MVVKGSGRQWVDASYPTTADNTTAAVDTVSRRRGVPDDGRVRGAAAMSSRHEGLPVGGTVRRGHFVAVHAAR